MIGEKKFERLKKDWDEKHRNIVHGFSIDPKSGNGDFAFNSCRDIIRRNDKSNVAHEVLEEVFIFLTKGLRWPNWADHMITTTNHKQTDMTKDPWIMAYCCAIHLGRYDLIEKYPPPTEPVGDKWARWSYFNRIDMIWYNSLLGRHGYWWLLWIRHLIPVAHVYVMYGFMEKAYKQA